LSVCYVIIFKDCYIGSRYILIIDLIKFYYETNIEIKDIEIASKTDPAKYKLFTKDIITIENNETEIKIHIIASPVRNCEYIAGILLLENNKTFGRTENKKRLLYKCIPDDKHLPAFLVPYDIKIGFNKVYQNKYVILQFIYIIFV